MGIAVVLFIQIFRSFLQPESMLRIYVDKLLSSYPARAGCRNDLWQ
jgi:hypothetical protein